MQKEKDICSVDTIVDTFKSHNLKITPQRIAVYKELIRSENHPTADDLFQTVRREFPGISFDTVNRTLLTFTDIGLADIIEGLGNQRRFDANHDSHHHLLCINCGRIIDYYDNSFDDIEIPDDINEKYDIIGKRVVVKILCDKCMKKESP